MNHVFICISSPEHLPKFKVLHASIMKHAPKIPVLLYYGGTDNPEFENTRTININQFITTSQYKSDFYKYCHARSMALLYTMQQHPEYDAVWMLGADTEFFDKPTRVMDDLSEHDACVSMYSFEPYPPSREDVYANDHSNLENGQINADFIGFRRTDQVMKFLEWVEDQTSTKCEIRGKVYVDQGWLSMCFSYLDSVKVIRHPGVNVQHANMFQRNMRKENDKWVLGDNADPLILFHYAGLDKGQEYRISRHQNRYIAEGDVLEFLKAYTSKL